LNKQTNTHKSLIAFEHVGYRDDFSRLQGQTLYKTSLLLLGHLLLLLFRGGEDGDGLVEAGGLVIGLGASLLILSDLGDEGALR